MSQANGTVGESSEKEVIPMGYVSVADMFLIVFAAMTIVILLVGLMLHIADRFSKK